MTTRITVQITCDTPGCPRSLTYDDIGAGLNASNCQEAARQKGWKADSREATCPEHRKVKRCPYMGRRDWGSFGSHGEIDTRCSLRVGHKGDHRAGDTKLVPA